MKRGANSITVRANNPPTDRSIARGKQYWEPKSKSIFYTRTSGIWQPVWLESTGDNYLRYVHVTAGQDGIAHFEGALAFRSAQRLGFRVSIFEGATEVGSADTWAQLDSIYGDVRVDPPKLCSPTSPSLYKVKYRLSREGEPIDEVKS